MASSVPEGHYRIWVNRKDTHNRISDENIWVGNIPLDGKSKITSGYTIGPNYSYVEFNSWADLLKAIGVDGPVVEYVDVYGTFEQGSGGGGDITIEYVDTYGTIEQRAD